MQKRPSGRITYYLLYSALFVLLCLIVFRWYFFAGKTFIWKVDGWDQHYKALVYYGKYLRTIIRTLLNKHQLILPEWAFTISEGSDILSVFHYYVMGDPLNLISAVVPSKYTHILFTGLVLLRLYLSGIAFSELCFYFDRCKKLPVMTGAFTYVFSYYAIVFAARHPYFLNPMVIFPLIILGAEKVLSKKSPVLLCLSVAVAAASNFYFFYMLVLLTVIYCVIRAFAVYKKDLRAILKAGGRVFLSSFTGVLISGISTLPVLYFFLSDSRLAVDRPWRLFYSLSYYQSLPSVLLSDYQTYWLCLSFTAPVLIGLFFLSLKKGRKVLKTLVLLGFIMILLPFFGKALNGFSYISYRFSWALCCLSSFILTDVFEDMMNMNKREKTLLLLELLLFTGLCYLTRKEEDPQLSSGLCLLWITYLLLWIPGMKQRLKNKNKQEISPSKGMLIFTGILVMMTAFLGIYRISYYRNTPEGADYASKLVDEKNIYTKLFRNETRELLQKMDAVGKETGKKESVVRYSGNKLTYNAGMLRGFSSTDYNWSLTNPYIDAFRTDLSLRENVISKYYGYDDRTDLLTLASVNYYVIPGALKATSSVPYGFSEVVSDNKDSIGNTSVIYKNDFSLPSGFLYQNYIEEDKWKKLDPLEKQQVMLSAAVVGDGLAHFPEEFVDTAFYQDEDDAISELPLEISAVSEELEISSDGLSVTSKKENEILRLIFDGKPSEEVYVQIEGLTFTPPKKEDETHDLEIGFKASSGTEKVLSYYTPDYDFYGGRHDFMINMGCHEEALSYVEITLPSPGTYSVDSIRVLSESFFLYDMKVAALREYPLKEISYGPDKMSGIIQNEEKGILCITVPYSRGFTAEVDGNEVPLFCVNGRYLGLYLKTGNHKVVLTYSRPYQKAGYFVSLSGLALSLMYLLMKRRTAGIRQNREEEFEDK